MIFAENNNHIIKNSESLYEETMTIELMIDADNTKTVESKLTFVPTCIGSVSSDQIYIDTVNLS